MLSRMTVTRVAALAALALGAMALNVAITILYMVVYSYVIDPGHDKAYYEAHVMRAAPYCSIVAGIPLMYLLGRWLGTTPAVIVWAIYAVIDLVIFASSGPTMKMSVLVMVSLLTKLGAAYFGGMAAGSRS
jgi:hypothetical protein